MGAEDRSLIEIVLRYKKARPSRKVVADLPARGTDIIKITMTRKVAAKLWLQRQVGASKSSSLASNFQKHTKGNYLRNFLGMWVLTFHL